MAINFDYIINQIRKLPIDKEVILTSGTALSIYGIGNNYLIEPYTILNDENLDSIDLKKYQIEPISEKIFREDLYVLGGCQITSPGKAMLDQILNGSEGDIYELLDNIDGTSNERVLKAYIQKYGYQKIMLNIMRNNSLQDFQHILDLDYKNPEVEGI